MKEELVKYNIGDSVKIKREFEQLPNGCQAELFWVRVKLVEDDGYVGVVDNELVCTDQHGLRYGNHVDFTEDNVLDEILAH